MPENDDDFDPGPLAPTQAPVPVFVPDQTAGQQAGVEPPPPSPKIPPEGKSLARRRRVVASICLPVGAAALGLLMWKGIKEIRRQTKTPDAAGSSSGGVASKKNSGSKDIPTDDEAVSQADCQVDFTQGSGFTAECDLENPALTFLSREEQPHGEDPIWFANVFGKRGGKELVCPVEIKYTREAFDGMPVAGWKSATNLQVNRVLKCREKKPR